RRRHGGEPAGGNRRRPRRVLEVRQRGSGAAAGQPRGTPERHRGGDRRGAGTAPPQHGSPRRRAGAVGRATGLHFDSPFFTRTTEKVYTVWIPLGDVPVTDGPLVVVEGSTRLTDLHDAMRGFDVARHTLRNAK